MTVSFGTSAIPLAPLGMTNPYAQYRWNAGDAKRPSMEALWDAVLTAGGTMWGVASDDAHDYAADGSGKYRLTDGPDKDAYATWAPNGRAIYFVRFGKGDSRIYRLRMRNGHCAG